MLKGKHTQAATIGGVFCLAAGFWAVQPAMAQTSADVVLDTVVVTGRAAAEDRAASPTTVQIIDEETIRKSNSASITDLLATSAVGFFSEWTPGQTSINIRGGASDGQGRDFKSQVLVLINGRRAGTANLSKLSPNEVRRIEVLRGPSSVAYGSQAIGGIINVIMKDGRNTEGGLADVRMGSARLVQGHLEHAATWGEDELLATYVGGTWGRKSNYDGGKGAGAQINTQWRRYGGLVSLDWNVNDSHDLQLMVRSDGVYDVGFRGSAANKYAKDDRINQSMDLNWAFNPADLPFKWNLQTYLIYDEDDLKWASPRSASTSKDFNTRKQYIMGMKFQPVISIGDSNDLMLGIDLEHSKLRSDRDRHNLAGKVVLTNPIDINQTEKVFAAYVEDTQRLFNDRLLLRAGVRYTRGETTPEDTPQMASVENKSQTYDKTTWSIGSSFQATDFLSFRAGVATGFRAPTATELSEGKVTYLSGGIGQGNSGLKPESNEQYELGMYLHGSGWYTDLAFYHNEIKDRITNRTLRVFYSPSGARLTETQSINNPDKIKMTGLEFDSRVNIDELTDMGNWRLGFGLSGNYNFEMKDESRKGRNRDEVDRVYKYQGSFFTQVGQGGEAAYPWSVRLTGILRGPVYYDTEETFVDSLGIEPAPSPSNYIHRKAPFMVWNLSGELGLDQSWTVYGGVNNLFDKNQHPLFIAIDDGTHYLAKPNDGGYGTSMPGREFYLGLKRAF